MNIITSFRKPDSRKTVLLVAAFLIVWAICTLMSRLWLVPQQRNFDFFPRWYGARIMLHGDNPYDVAATEELLVKEDLNDIYSPWGRFFYYPAWITYLLLPFWLLPFPLSVSIWTGLQLTLSMIMPMLLIFYVRRHPSPLLLAAVVLLSTVGFYHTVNVFVLGQFMMLVLIGLLAAWWFTINEKPWLAGLALVFVTVRPEGMVFAAMFIVGLLLDRRYKEVGIFTGMMVGLVLISFAHIGFWIPDFVSGILIYGDTGEVAFIPSLLGSPVLKFTFIAGMFGWGGWLWWSVRNIPPAERLLWQMAAVIVLALLLLPQAQDYSLAYTLLPIWFCLLLDLRHASNLIILACLMLASWVFALAETPLFVQQISLPLALGILITIHRLENHHLPRLQSSGTE